MTKVYSTRDLPIWAKHKLTVVSTETKEEREEIATYRGMDWMYGKFYLDDWTLLNAVGEHIKEWDLFVFKPKDE